MVGSFFLVSILAFFLFLLSALGKGARAGDIQAKSSQLDEHQRKLIREFIDKERQVQTAYIRPFLWSWILMVVMTVVMAFRGATWMISGSALIIAMADYVIVTIILEFTRYAPRRRRLNREKDFWLLRHPVECTIIDRLDGEVYFSNPTKDYTN